jgi:hypothetical protein
MSSKAIAALTRVRLNAGMDLGVSLEVVLADKTFLTVRTLVLAVIEMCLHMRLDVLLPPESFTAVLEVASPSAVLKIRAFDVLSNVVYRYSSLSLGILNVDASDACCALHACYGVRSPVGTAAMGTAMMARRLG